MMKTRPPAPMAAARVLALLAPLSLELACRSSETTASKSAAAYDEALRKGEPVKAGEAHGQHGQAQPRPQTTMEAASPAAGGAMPGMDHSQMTGHSSAPPKPARAHGASTVDHAAMGHGSGASAPATGSMKGMDHSTMSSPKGAMEPAETDHAAMGHGTGAATAPAKPEPAAAVAVAGQPGRTLLKDAKDEAAPTSIDEAARASAMAASGHAMQHGTYKQTDAGRESTAQTGHEGHGSGAAPAKSAPKASPTPSPKPAPPHKHEDHR